MMSRIQTRCQGLRAKQIGGDYLDVLIARSHRDLHGGAEPAPRRTHMDVLSMSLAADCGSSCPRSCNGLEGLTRPSRFSCLQGMGFDNSQSQTGALSRQYNT